MVNLPKPTKADMTAFYIGVDPGVSGGLAVKDRGAFYTAVAMPTTDQDILSWLSQYEGPGSFAVIELVGGYVAKDRGQSGMGSSMFRFGKSYGGLLMALTALSIPFDVVSPARWQKGVGVPPRKKTESRTDWKNRLKARAQQLFPGGKVTLSTADALLIATYCMRIRTGTL